MRKYKDWYISFTDTRSTHVYVEIIMADSKIEAINTLIHYLHSEKRELCQIYGITLYKI